MTEDDAHNPARLELAQAEALLALSAALNADLQLSRVLDTLLDQIAQLVRADRAAIFLRRGYLTDFEGGLRGGLPTISFTDLAAPNENPLIGSLSDVSISVSALNPQQDESDVVCVAARRVPSDFQLALGSIYNAALSETEPEAARLRLLLERPFYVRDTVIEYRIDTLRPASLAAGIRSIFSLPLVHRGKMLGWLALFHDAPYLYRASETNSLILCANQAAMAVSNAILYEEAQRRGREAQQMADAAARFGSSLELDEVLSFVAENASTILGARALIFLMKPEAGFARPVAQAGFATRLAFEAENPPIGARVESGTFGLSADMGGSAAATIVPGEGAVGRAIESGAFYFGRTPQQARPAAPFLPQSGNEAPTSLMAFPLKVRGRSFGALLVYTCRASGAPAFVARLEERHISIGLSLADRAALAIENARIYDTLRKDQRAKDEFLSLVAHELRTPLTTMRGYNANLDKRIAALGSDGMPLKRYSDVIATQIDRLSRLIEDLLDISRLEMGRFALNMQDEDIVEIAQTTLENAQVTYRATRPDPAAQRHTFSGGTTTPRILVRLDRPRIEQVVQNLLTNAVKYSPRGGTVRLTVVDAGDTVRLTVEDQGLGIPAADQPRIFDKFFRSAAHPNKAGGLGLGLFIVRAIVAAHGGTISVKSEEGVGSAFTVTLEKAPTAATPDPV